MVWDHLYSGRKGMNALFSPNIRLNLLSFDRSKCCPPLTSCGGISIRLPRTRTRRYSQPLVLCPYHPRVLASLCANLWIEGSAKIVLIGDGTHGTHEFYAHRANLTERLISEKGFSAVAIEADWPDAACANRFVSSKKKEKHGQIADKKRKRWAFGQDPEEADPLREFQRFPKWMWKNAVMPPFLRWLRNYNSNLAPQQKVGIYGMDLYSLHRSAAAVVSYLEKVDPETAKRARQRYNCFEKFGEDTHTYAWASLFGLSKVRYLG
jgi:hypothetical protein